MAQLKVANYLGMLQEDPDNEEAFHGLREALTNGDTSAEQSPIRLLEMARMGHEQRGELRAAAWLIELEAPLIDNDPDFEAALFKELGRLRREELLDDEGARTAYERALELRPGDTEVEEAIEQVEQAASNWKQIAKRFVEEADDASDATLKTSLLTRAASLVWQYKKRGREKEVDKLFEKALEADPAATRAARLFAETLQIRERWDDLAKVLLSAADHARNRDEKLNLYLRAGRVLARRLDSKEEAAGCYERVLDFSPGHEEALRYLVEHFTLREEWEHLVALYEDALRSRQKLESEQGILLQIAMVQWRIRNSPDQAEPYFARLRKIDPAHPGMLSFYRDYLKTTDDPQRLLTILGDAQRVSENAGQKLELAIELARAAQENESTHERAIDAWKAVQRLDATSTEAQTALRFLYRSAERWNALVELLKAELEALPKEDAERRLELLREMVPIYRDRLQLDVMVINTFNAILQLEPDDAAALDSLAATFESMGRWNDLIQILTRQAEGAEDKARKVELYTRVAGLWIERFANYNQATRPLEDVIAIDPENRQALSQLKEIYEKKRAWSPLFDVLRREADLASDPETRLLNRIQLARLAGDRLHRHADAISLWKQVVDEAPDTEGALDALEKLAEREKDWATLAEALERRVDTTADERDRIKILQKLGTVYGEHLEEPAKAARAWKRVLDIDPKNGRATRTLRESFLAARDWDGLEALYAESDDWEGLVEVLGQAAERTDDGDLKVQLSFRAAEVYENRIGEPHRAFRNYERVLSADPKNVRAARALLPIYEKDEKWSRLVGLKEILLETLGGDAPVEERLALLEELRVLTETRLSDSSASFGWARGAYALAPTDEAIIAGLEQSADHAGAHEQLVDVYRARLSATADDEEKLRLRRRVAAIAGERLGRAGEAIEQLERILETTPNDVEAIDVLDRLYRTENRVQDLRKLFLLRIEHAADADEKYIQLGELARLEEDLIGDAESAVSRYEAMLELEPSDVDALRALDRLHAAADRIEPLVEIVRRRRELASDDSARVELTMRLGALLADRLADPRGALDAYSDVLDTVPGHEGAVAGLEALEKSSPAMSVQLGRLLESAYEARSSHEKLAGVLQRRLEATEDEEERRELRLRLAEIAGTQLGDVDGAYTAIEAAFLDRPSDTDLWDRLGEAADRASRHEDLAEAYGKALESGGLPGSDVADLASRVARIYDEILGRPEHAEPFHKKVLHEDPLSERSFEALKELYTNGEKWDELQVLYRNRIAQTVDGEQKLELLLQVCFLFEELLDDPQLAIRAYQDVIELEPQHIASRRALERLYRRTERWRDLAALLRQELDGAEGQDALDLTFELGELYEKRLKEPLQAVDQYEAVLAENPTHLRSQEALERLIEEPTQRQRIASILEPLYDAQGAWTELARVLEVQLEDVSDPGSRVGLLLRIAEIHEGKLHDLDAGFQALARAVEADPADTRAREEISRVSQLRDSERERAEVLEKALTSVEEGYLQSDLLMEIARLWDESVGDTEQAERAYERLIGADSDNESVVLPASRALERIHLTNGEHGKLAEDLRRQVKFEHDQDVRKSLLVRLADLLEEVLDDADGAITAHGQRLEIDPSDIDALRSLERLHERKEEWQKLIGVLSSRDGVTDDQDEQRDIARRVGGIYETKLEDRENAIVAYNDVVSRFGPDRDTLAALCRLYEATGKWDDLLEVVQQDQELVGDPIERSELRYRAAELMRTRTGDLTRAIETYGEVLVEVPDHAGTIAALEEVVRADDRDGRVSAARALAPRYEGSADYQKFLGVLDVLADSDDPVERLRSLRRAAEVADVGLEEPARAFDLMGRAVRAGLSEPDVGDMLHELERLTAASDRWGPYVELLKSVTPEIFDGDLQTQMYLRVAEVASTRLEDDAVAREYYEKVLTERPDHSGALDSLERLCEKAEDHQGLLEVLRRKTELAADTVGRVELLLRQAELCDKQLENVPGAIDAYEQVLNESERTEAYDGLERLYEKAERWDDLASLLERRLDNEVGDPVEVRFRLGRASRDHLGDNYRAIDCFREALAKNAEHQPTISALDKMMSVEEHRAVAAEILEPVYLRRMDWPRVKTVLEARVAAEQDLDQRKVLLRRLGEMHEDYLQDLEGALETYARLFREDPADSDVWDTMARLARHLDNHGRLAEIYDAALDEISVDEPETARLAFLTGRLHDEKTGNVDRAAQLYKRALDFDPTDRAAFEALESALSRETAHEALLELYRQQVDVVTSDEERVALLHKVAAIKADALADAEGAIDVHREILETDPRDAGATVALDNLLTSEERWADLADHLRHRIDMSVGAPEEIEHRHRLGAVLAQKLDDKLAALDVFEEVARMAPSHAPTIEALEVMVQEEEHQLRITQILEPIYRAEDQWKKLIAILEAQVGLSDEPMETVRLLGEIGRLHEDRGKDGGRAFRAWARAFALDPGNEEVRAEIDRLGGLLAAWDEHVAAYEQAISNCSDAMVVTQLLGTVARVHDEHRGDPRSAIETYERLLTHEPGDGSPLDALEGLHTMVGDWRGLVDVLSRKTERCYEPAERGELLRRMGSVLEELLNDREGAIQAYERASEEEDEDGIALEALDRLYGQAGDSARLTEVLRKRFEREQDPGERVALGVRLGTLCETQLNDPDQAIEAFARVLDDHPGQSDAVVALARLYERQAMWPELLENLRLRAGMAERNDERVGFVHRAGEVLERELDDVPEALTMYQEALELDGRHEPSISALMRIANLEDYRDQAAEILEPRLEIQERWDDVAKLVGMKADGAHDPVDKRVHLRRLARVHEDGRKDVEAAFEALSRALAEDPGDEETADELTRVAGAMDGWDRLADALAARASSVLDPMAGRGLYTRLARVAEERLGDDVRAIEAYSRAAEQVGDDVDLLTALDRLYTKTEAWTELGEILDRRVGLANEPAERNELLVRLGALKATHFGDLRGAYNAYQEVLEQDPTELVAMQAMEELAQEEALAAEVVETLDNVYRQTGATDKVAALYDVRIRLAGTDGERVRLLQEVARIWEADLGQPDKALEALRRAFVLDPRDDLLLGDLERLAGAAGAWESLRGVVEQVSESADIDRMVLRDLNVRAASWYRDRLGDVAAAEARLLAAIESDPDAAEAHEQRVDILRTVGGRELDLVTALRAWAEIEMDDVAKKGRLREAARLAESALDDVAMAGQCLEAILESDPTDAEALEELARIRTSEEKWSDVVSLLGKRVDGEMDPTVRLGLRKRIAGIYGGPLERAADAVSAWEGVLDEQGGDMEAVEALEALYEQAERWEDLQRLIERRLDFAQTPGDQVAARVRLARLVEQRFGRRDEAMEQLREILEIDGKNAEALDELERLLGLDAKWEELVQLLSQRVADASAAGAVDQEVTLLGRLATVFVANLDDAAQAVEAYERQLVLEPVKVDAIEALVALHEKTGDWERASVALERLAGVQQGPEAIATWHRLADVAKEKLGDNSRTEQALRSAYEVDPSSEATRELLKAHYEGHEDWAQLANMLAIEEQEATGQDAKVELLKRIADLYDQKLQNPGQAAESLERASQLVPEDRSVLLPLCDLYIAAGRSQDAIPVLEKIIESYGTRRVKEVAQYHHRLGRALEGMGDVEGALSRYDSAFKIDLTNVQILRDLGRLCHQGGDLDRAQKTFRALLLQKLKPEDGITKADVYFYLGDISAKGGDANKAKSMLQRALAEDKEHAQAKALLDTLG